MFLYLILVSIMIFISVSLSGLFAPPFSEADKATAYRTDYKCCDTGDGENCRSIKEDGFTYDGQRYNLLKSDGYLDYSGDLTNSREQHLDPAGGNRRVVLDHKGRRVFLNRSDKRGSDVYPECIGRGRDNTGYDRLYGKPDERNTGAGSTGKGCYAIPNDLLIYVCRPDSNSDCFGDDHFGQEIKFDVYIRQRDVDQRGIPEAIKNCYKPPERAIVDEQILFRPSPEGQSNLQLRTFQFTHQEPPLNWLTPYCKPAIYLYPERKTEVNVSVFPKGKMLLTIPEYPKLGWDVVAEPDGDIFTVGKRFDYLYYEASIPDEMITVPDEGFVISYDSREESLTNIIAKLGLQGKEAKQFLEYWVPILPKAPYYFIGVVPVSNLDSISPVLISPKPDTFIRVTLYFKPLQKAIKVSEPHITPVTRSGFTAVEWGGIVKRDKDHPFSCFM